MGERAFNFSAELSSKIDFVFVFKEWCSVILQEVIADSILELLIQVVSWFLLHVDRDVEHIVFDAIFGFSRKFH